MMLSERAGQKARDGLGPKEACKLQKQAIRDGEREVAKGRVKEGLDSLKGGENKAELKEEERIGKITS